MPPPAVLIVIVAPPDLEDIPSIDAARRLEYPRDHLAIVVARGRNPSAQRNAAVEAQEVDWIYFLDDDACPVSTAIRIRGKTAVSGGGRRSPSSGAFLGESPSHASPSDRNDRVNYPEKWAGGGAR